MTGKIDDFYTDIEKAYKFRSDLRIATIAHEIENLDFLERQSLYRVLQTRLPISIKGEPWPTEEE